jgi:hypothetical protein
VNRFDKSTIKIKNMVLPRLVGEMAEVLAFIAIKFSLKRNWLRFFTAKGAKNAKKILKTSRSLRFDNEFLPGRNPTNLMRTKNIIPFTIYHTRKDCFWQLIIAKLPICYSSVKITSTFAKPALFMIVRCDICWQRNKTKASQDLDAIVPIIALDFRYIPA